MTSLLRRVLPPALPLLALAACGGGGDGDPLPGLSGSLSVFLPDGTTLEAEPNGTLAQAHQLGDLAVGGSRRVLGTITQDAPDELDVFELRAPERVLVDVTLTGISTSADLDLYVYDPVSLQIVQAYTTNSASESGSFAASGTFFVVVDSFAMDSDYELEINASAITAGVAESEPNDTAAGGDYLGLVAPGDSVRARGDGSAADSDYYLFSVPSGQSVDFLLECSAGDDYDVNVYDATADVANPTLVQGFNAGGSTESGSVPVTGMTLFALEVVPFNGASAAYTVDIDTVSMLTAGLAPPRPRFRQRSARASFDGMARNPDALHAATEVPARTARGSIIVEYAAGVDGPGDGAMERFARVDGEIPGGARRLRLDVPEGLDDAEAARYALAFAATLRGRADVVSAELDPWATASAAPQGEVRPDDPFYNLQWHYEQIGLPTAWATTTGDPSVRVAILDTGSVPAMDLVDVGGIDVISDPQTAGDGDGVDNDPTDVGDGVGPQPSSFHGAHVAGTVGARTDNGFGVSGVAWQCEIVHVRCLGIGGGSTFDIANGVRWAAGLANATGQVANPRVDIINMSLGGPGFSSTLQDACSAARAAGVVVIAAAGNENSSAPSYPAAYDDVVSVAAVDYERRRAPYSNFHPTVDLAAPGGDVSVDLNGDGYADGVLSTKPDDSVTPTNYDSFSFYQGTSMAAPHVAGVAALLLSVDPMLTPAQIESILTSTATDLGAAGRDDRFGEGLVNAAAAVAIAGGGGGAPPDLALGATSVLFDGGAGTRLVGVTNVGGGALSVTSVTATTSTGGPWLSAARVATPTATTTDTSGVELVASPSGLAAGTYGGSVAVQSNGGDATIAVNLVVGASGSTEAYEVFVIAVEANSLVTEAQDIVRTDGALGYSLDLVPEGTYLIVAGTDEDGDGFICDEGEPLCGLYPSLDLASEIPLADGERRSGLDFPVQSPNGPIAQSMGGPIAEPMGGPIAASTGGPVGFRLLAPRTEGVDR